MLGRVRRAAVAVQARAAGLCGGARSFPRLRLPQTGWRGHLADAAAAGRSAAGYHVAHLSTAATPPPTSPGAVTPAAAPAAAAAAAAVKPAGALATATATAAPATPTTAFAPTPGGIPSLRAIHPKTASAPPEVGNSHSLWINNVYRFGLLINYWRIIGKPFEKLFNLHPGQRMEQQVHAELREVFGKHGVGLSVSHIVSQFKEKGVYVTFAHPKYAELAYKKRELLKFRGKPLNAYIVKGVPFIEDIVSTKASPKLKVTLYPVPPSNDKDKDTPTFFHAQNQFFGLLRPYGLCYDLHTEGKNVYVTFVTKQAATTARNCLHGWRVSIQPPATQKPTIATGAAPGAPVPPTPMAPTGSAAAPAVTDAVQGVINGSLVVSFEPYSRFKPIREAFMNPRLLPILVLLVIVALLMAISPLRLVNVTQNLATAWSEKEKPRNTVQERDELEQLRALFTQLPTSVTVITGPKGSGKSDLIKKILHKRRFVARIDCSAKDLVGGTASKEMAFIENFQHAIGFWPSFSTINTLISYVETLLPTKSSALTANQSLQLTSVLGTLEQALRIVSINFPRNQNASYEYPIVVFDGFHTLIQGLESRANNEKERETAQMILDSLIKWSIECTQVNQTAHIVFVADNAFTTDILSRNERLRGRLNEIFVGDLPRDSAFAYIAENVAAHAKNVTEVPADDDAAAERAAKPAAVAPANRGLGLDFGVFSILRNLAKLPGSAPRDANSSAGASGAAGGAAAAAAASNARVAAVPDGTIVTNAGAGGDDEEAVLKLQISQRLSAAIDKAIDVIGGRMSDMDSLVNRTRTGKSISDALREMNAEARRDILHRGFGSKLFVDSALPGRSWNQIHLWKCVKLLSQHVPLPPHADPALTSASAGSAAAAAAAAVAADTAKRAAAGENGGGNGDATAPSPALLYRNVLYSVFDGDEEALRSLVSENILTLQQPPRAVGAPAPAAAASASASASGGAAGAPAERLPEDRWVNAGSPLLLHAMRSLTRDAKFTVLMDNMVLKAEIKKTKAEVDEVEAELVRLAEAQFSGAGEVRSRLYAKLADKTKLIKAAEAQIKRI